MTDLRGINSTSHTTQTQQGLTIHTVRDSLAAEIMLSLISGITILSFMTFVKCYVEVFDVSLYPHYSVLLIAVIHTVIRRMRINKIFPILVMHVIADGIFYIVATGIPVLEFGNRNANRLYLILILIGFTVFSVAYRIKPSFDAGNQEFIVFPAAIHVIGYILYKIGDKEEFAQTLIINAVIIAIIFICMRQIAVFDSKYYHSIHKLSRPSSLLKKQNYKTLAGLVGIIAVTLGVLFIFPYSMVSGFLKMLARGIVGGLRSLFSNFQPDYNLDVELEDPLEDADIDMDLGEGSAWAEYLITIISKALFFLLVVAAILLLLNTIRLLVKNMPKLKKDDTLAEDDRLVDTIEYIVPEKKKDRVFRNHDFGTGRERRVRKQFYDKMHRAMKKGLPVYASSTPGEVETVLLANGDKDISALKQEYEKVRYGK